MTIKLVSANIVTALDSPTIGTRVTDVKSFFEVAEKAIQQFDFASPSVPGQAFIPLPEAVPFLSAGVGKRSVNPADYTLRLYRGRVEPFLRREFAAPCDSAAIVVYTRQAYLADPDVQQDSAESSRIEASGSTHVLVAVLGFAGPQAPLSPFRLVHNLAGGNREAQAWTADEIRAQAAASLAYDADWSVVAD